MRLLSTVKVKTEESNQNFFNRQLKVAMSNYRDARTRRKGESWKDWFERFENFEEKKEYGIDYILKLRGNGVDTEKKRNKRIKTFNNFFIQMLSDRDDSILDSLNKKKHESFDKWELRIKKILDDNVNFIFEQREFVDESMIEYQKRICKYTKFLSTVENEKNVFNLNAKIEEVKQSKVDDVYNKIKAKSKFEKDMKEKDEAEETEEILNNKREVYDKKNYQVFIMLIGIIFLCIFLKLWFISSILGYASFIVFGISLAYFYIDDDIYNKVNDNEWYRMFMNFMFKFSSVTTSVMNAAGHTTVRK